MIPRFDPGENRDGGIGDMAETIGAYLIGRLGEEGVGHVFGGLKIANVIGRAHAGR